MITYFATPIINSLSLNQLIIFLRRNHVTNGFAKIFI